MILAVSTSKNLPSPAIGYRGRFAPSPTGPLHAGSLVAALGSWLDARKNGGKWLLRMEDLDTPRCVPGADLQIQSQLLACGLSWDEGVIYQSQRQNAYQSALERLKGLNCLYPCTCSRQTIAIALEKLGVKTPRNQEMIYPGTCRPAALESAHFESAYLLGNSRNDLGDLKKAWRIALPENCHIEFLDLALGTQSQDLNAEVGDFVLRRSDSLFTYQLAVVVDDAEQGITHIVRGKDLLTNTARQIFLQEKLGYLRPRYLHLPLVLDGHGEKLSKQTLATQINTQDQKHALYELRKAANHLGLKDLPDSENTTIAEWLLAATHAWQS
jgi:glutamyl-Q tRNA(Asp) synthetase